MTMISCALSLLFFEFFFLCDGKVISIEFLSKQLLRRVLFPFQWILMEMNYLRFSIYHFNKSQSIKCEMSQKHIERSMYFVYGLPQGHHKISNFHQMTYHTNNTSSTKLSSTASSKLIYFIFICRESVSTHTKT